MPTPTVFKIMGAAVAAALVCPAGAQAQSFAQALVAARGTDAIYSAKLADVRTRRLQSSQSRAAFLPSANVSYRCRA